MQIPDNYTPAPDCLKDRNILITGAANGIGRAAAMAYAGHGATIIALDKDVKGLESLYDELEDKGLPEAALYPMDLEGAKDKDYADLAEALVKEFGMLHGLLHNAARRDALTPMEHVELDDWFDVMQVNLNAPFMLTQACLPLLKAAPAASLVFTTDQQSRKHHAYWGAYGISKHGLDALMLTLADELENQTNVRVNSIDPGAVRTNMRVKSFAGLDPKDMIPPEDVMNAYIYLMADDSAKANGETLNAQKPNA